MPSYGSWGPPSLQKMDNGNGYGSHKRFDFGRVIGNPFILSTVSIALLSFIIAFVSSIVAATRTDFPNYVWWSLVFMFCSIVGVTFVVVIAAEHTYHVAISSLMGAGLVFTTSSINSLIYSPEPAFETAAAGFVLLSIIDVIWLFYFGSTPDSGPHAFVDSYALHRPDRQHTPSSRQMSNNYTARPQSMANPAPQMYTSAQLNGFETSSPVSGFPGGPVGGMERNSQPRFGGPALGPQGSTSNPQEENEAPATVEYPYRAKAIYSYEANPDDDNEISFSKHDILEVSDVSGRWWQAKKANGETGIAPSNYLILL